ncbi:AMP-binding protein [Edaphobacter sp. HDX4]|uniref:AMP-binding protein n=1 Tax=Edaphobacter sp. HDX4 TaxID=2794064 RepID=UPI002FE5939B
MRSHLASLVDDFRRHAQETAIVSHRGVRSYRTTYGELALLAGRFSSELTRRKIGPGERVLLWGENSAEWMAAFFGCLLRGVLAVPLDAAGSSEFAARILEEVKPRLVVANAKRSHLACDVPMLDLSKLRQSLPPEPNFSVDPSVQESAPFQIIFTSGTTSEPKGIVHTHRNVLASLGPIEAEISKYRRYERWVHPLRFLQTLPLSHVFGQFMGLWIPGVLAAEVHFTDGLDSGRLVQIIRSNRVSVLVAVPRVLALMRSHLLASRPQLEEEISNSIGLSILKRWWRFRAIHRVFGWKFWAVISGGAALPAGLEIFWNRLGFALIQGYGMTETAALVTLNHPFGIGQGTIGKPLPGREVRLSGTGELLVRGDMVADTTWEQGRLLQREGEWLATGDLAEQTESGDFRFVGRKGDVIVSSSGLNIYPSDLEAAMLVQPGVQACTVVPCDLASGPEPVCVVLFEGEDTALQQAIRDANRSLADFQQMRRVLRWPEITFPYTSTGKLLRRTLRDWACRTIRSQGAEASPPQDFLLTTISSITGEPVSANGSDDLRLSEDLHLDSLGRVQLVSAIEQRTGILIDDAQMATLNTLGELRRAALGRPAAEQQANGTPVVTRGGPSDIDHLAVSSHTAESAPAPAASETSGESSAAHYPRWPWSPPVRLLRSIFIDVILRPIVHVLLAPQVTSSDVPPHGPLLIVANHVTALDAALVLYALPASLRRRVAIMMSGEMLADFRSGKSHGVAGRAASWLLTALFNVFPLPRLQGFRQSFAHAGEAIDRGYSVLIFPEGTRSRTGETAPFRQGIGLLSAQAGVPVLPVVLIGLEKIRGRGVKWFRSRKIEVRIGEPVKWTESRSAAEWTSALEKNVRDLRRGSN